MVSYFLSGGEIVSGLSASMQNYIKAIYELSSGGAGVRSCDIAEKVGVTKASVCNAIKNLERQNFVYRDIHRLVYLTKSGAIQAEILLDKSAIIQRFLCEVLGIDKKVANADACAIETIISQDTLCALCQFINRQCGGCYMKSENG